MMKRSDLPSFYYVARPAHLRISDRLICADLSCSMLRKHFVATKALLSESDRTARVGKARRYLPKNAACSASQPSGQKNNRAQERKSVVSRPWDASLAERACNAGRGSANKAKLAPQPAAETVASPASC